MDEKDLKIQILKRELDRARNELCLRCGKYHEKHLGACKDCHFDTEYLKAVK